MSHKIHPNNYRLGYLLEWKNKWYTYSYNYSNFLIKNLKLYEYINRILYKQSLFLGNLILKDYRTKLLINLTYYSHSDLHSANLSLGVKDTFWYSISQLLQFYFKKFVQINHYCHSSLLQHPNFIVNWICLMMEKEVDLKIILNQLKSSIKKIYENEKIDEKREIPTGFSSRCTHYSICYRENNERDFSNYYYCDCITSYDRFFGTKTVFLKGVKILVNGRLLGLKNQITTSETIEIGTVPLQTKEYTLLFAIKDFVTKYGVYGIKVWMFYK
uniref:30S ribosomal protein S3 n=1 Tax=Cyanidiococcus yangmingshanensis TaxID=2690220 RepID=A0A7G5VUD0_9RHOD|nr:30S ribosomal protein S3 [Cyanidiococcus yangmingshanensis]QMX77297.1 30S ribosomal protein S3 [Cyanidiococcus yangmingshanensis]